MSACYSVSLKIKVKDEQGAFNALLNKINRGDKENTNYSLESHKEEGLVPNSLVNCIKIFLAEWKGHNEVHTETHANGFIEYYSDFNASYGWEVVMMEMFEELTPYIADGSRMLIYPDSDYDDLRVVDGKYVQVH